MDVDVGVGVCGVFFFKFTYQIFHFTWNSRDCWFTSLKGTKVSSSSKHEQILCFYLHYKAHTHIIFVLD